MMMMMMMMMKQRKRRHMICTNWWLQTQTIFLISLVIFVKITFCIGKETLYFCSNMFFYVHCQTMILQEKLIGAKNSTKWCNMSIFDKVHFSSFGAWVIMKLRLEPSFLTWETWGIFCGGSRHPKKAMCKAMCYVLCYIFSHKKCNTSGLWC